MKALLLFSLFFQSATSQPLGDPKPARRLVGEWIMNLEIGAQMFADEVSVRPGPGGESGGSLTVPGRFTAPLRNIREEGERFSFEIVADEGRGPFTVLYEGRFHGEDDVFVGFASLADQGGRLLGGFVGRRR